MTGPATCELIGRWRIIEADLWDRDYLDLVEPAHLQIGNDGWAEFALGAVNATAELKYGRGIVFFHWSGFDKGDEISVTEQPNCRTTAPSKSSCPSTMAMTQFSPRAASDFFTAS
jgi:hypothetical protein